MKEMTSKAGMGYTQFSSNVIKIKKLGFINPFEILVQLVHRTAED